MEENKRIEIIGQYGATLSMIEVGLGSILHAFHVPFSGVLLSLNQGFILARATLFSRDIEGRYWLTYSISNIAAVLKSLSPAGKKLGPMLSLSMQGLLFNLGVRVFGTNIVGLCVGMSLLSLWTFIQPLVTYYLFFGEKLFTAAQYLFEKTLPYHQIEKENLFFLFLLFVLIKIAVGIGLVFFAWSLRSKSIYGRNYEDKLIAIAHKQMMTNTHQHKPTKSIFFLVLSDLCRPLFIASILITGVFLYFSQHQWGEIIWYLMRPVAIGFIFFYLSRTLTLDRWLLTLENGRWSSFSKSCQVALNKMRSYF